MHGVNLYLSAFLVLPTIVGQFIETKIRSKLSNEIFKKLILVILIVVGISLLLKNINL